MASSRALARCSLSFASAAAFAAATSAALAAASAARAASFAARAFALAASAAACKRATLFRALLRMVNAERLALDPVGGRGLGPTDFFV